MAAAHSTDPVVPLRAACCGFAGNQGFVHPEITEGATRAEAEDVRALIDTAARHRVLDLPHLRDRHVPGHEPRATPPPRISSTGPSA